MIDTENIDKNKIKDSLNEDLEESIDSVVNKNENHEISEAEVEKLVDKFVNENTRIDRIYNELLIARDDNESLINTLTRKLDFSSNIFPLHSKNTLEHLDILLDTAKSFLVISVTVITTFSVLDPSKIPATINLDIIGYVFPVSVSVLILSVIAMFYILHLRRSESNKFAEKISKLEKHHYDVESIRARLIELTSKDGLKKVVKKSSLEACKKFISEIK
jgi:hypothetical protein